MSKRPPTAPPTAAPITLLFELGELVGLAPDDGVGDGDGEFDEVAVVAVEAGGDSDVVESDALSDANIIISLAL